MAKSTKSAKISTQVRVLKVKLLKSGGVHTEYEQSSIDGSMTNQDKIAKDSPVIPHPDFQNSITGLSEILTECCGLLVFKKALNAMSKAKMEEVTAKEKESAKALSKSINLISSEIVRNVSVTGISINGEEGKKSVVISGVYACNGNYKIAINTPRILLSGNSFGIEEQLESAIAVIEEETLQYLFEGKKSQIAIDFQNEEKSEE